MSCQIDQAQRIETFSRDRLVSAVARAAQAEATPAEESACLDCDEAIEPERRQVLPGATRCLTCQESLEHRRRLCRT